MFLQQSSVQVNFLFFTFIRLVYTLKSFNQVLCDHFDTFQQYYDSNDNSGDFSHNNCDMKCSYRYISKPNLVTSKKTVNFV